MDRQVQSPLLCSANDSAGRQSRASASTAHSQNTPERPDSIAQLLLCRFLDVSTNMVQVVVLRNKRLFAIDCDPRVFLCLNTGCLRETHSYTAHSDPLRRVFLQHTMHQVFQAVLPVVGYGRSPTLVHER